jgi:thiol-disulfide isomerase/thioredoxin
VFYQIARQNQYSPTFIKMKTKAKVIVISLVSLITLICATTRTPIVKNSDSNFDYGFILKDIQGNKVDAGKFKGKVVFLNLWATWCGPCRAEMASIEKLYAGLNKKNIEFVMLSLDRPGAEQNVKNYITSKQFTFPVFMPVESLPQQLNVPSIPTTFIIDKNGKIVAKEVGSTNYNTREYKELLEGLASK